MFDEINSLPTQREFPSAGPDAEPSLGRIDQYRLLRKLGGGGFGVVYLARDTFSGAEVALKTLHPLLKHDLEELERVRANFLLVSRLHHPNVAAALVLHQAQSVEYTDETAKTDLRLSPGEPVMVMTYAPGVPLSKWRLQFPDGIVPLDRTLDVARQIAAALDTAHAEKIVHRDVKPGNIMVETDPDSGHLRVRVLDFGLAAEIRSSMSRISREGGDTSGTRPYMAPEQWAGKRQDGRTDQYALAALVYELLSGAPPFAGVFETGDVGIMLAAVKTEEPEEVEDVPEEVNAALRKALAKTREERFATCGEFVATMEGAKSESIETAKSAERSKTINPRIEEWTTERMGAFLQRRIAVQRRVQSLPEKESDEEMASISQKAKDKFSAAEEALKLNRMEVAEFCLIGAESAFEERNTLSKRRQEEEEYRREEAARIQREEKRRQEEEKKRKQEEEKARFHNGVRREFIAHCIPFSMVYVEPGTFQMGSSKDEQNSDSDEAQHQVTLTKGYWIGETPVTQALWHNVMGSNPSAFQRRIVDIEGGLFGIGEKFHYEDDPHHPVENVSWNDCQVFLEKLNAILKSEGFRFVLPTEAQWEFAARGGTKSRGTDYSGSNSLDEVAWYNGNSDSNTHPVKEKKANELGLYDMSGNVWEWCSDWYGDYPSGSVTDPTGPASGGFRVSRGGS